MMKRATSRRAVIAVALVLLGWVAGRAQSSNEPDFEITINAPEGETVVECVRGCGLQWVARGVNPDGVPQRTFSWKCQGPPSGRCGSGRIGGWLQR